MINIQEKLSTLMLCGLLVLQSCSTSTTESGETEVQTGQDIMESFAENHSEFTLHLDIRTHEDLRILLQGYYWKEFLTLDTIVYGIADIQKAHTLTTPYRNGFYRLLLDEPGAKPLYFIINGRNSESIKIETDLAKLYHGEGSISPEQEMACLASVKLLFERNNKLLKKRIEELYSVSKIQPKYNTLKDSLGKQMELQKLSFTHQLDSLKEICNNTYVEQVVIRSLRKPNRYENKEALVNYETEPAYLHQYYFQNVTFNNEDYLGHPIFFQTVKEYLQEYSGVYPNELEESVDIVFANIQNEEIQNNVGEFLIRYYLDKEYEQTAEYVASNYLVGCNDDYIEELKKTERYKAAPAINNKAPLFTLPDVNNKMVALQDIISSSQLTLVYFWKSSCTVCQEEHKNFIKLQDMFGSFGLQIVGVSIDKDKASFTNTLASQNFNYPNLCNYKGAWEGDIKNYKVLKTPSLYLIYKTGDIMIKDIYNDKLQEILLKYFNNYE